MFARYSSCNIKGLTQVNTVIGLAHGRNQPAQLSFIDKAHSECNLFGAGDLEALPLLKCTNELGGLKQAVRRSRIEPGIATPKQFNGQVPALQVRSINVRYLKFATRGGREARSDIDHLLIVKIQAGYRPVRSRLGGFLLNADGVHLLIEFDDAVSFGIVHVIRENGCAELSCARLAKHVRNAMSKEDIVAEHKRG